MGHLDFQGLSVGLVHDWLPVIGGAERVLEQMHRVFPAAEVYTLFDFLSDAERREILDDATVHTSALNNLPFIRRYYRYLLLSATRAVEKFDLRRHDLVISSSAALAKGVLTAPGQPHIAYVHSPARYAWDLTHDYIGNIRLAPMRFMAHNMMHRFRMWDMRTTSSVDVMLANSKFIQKRIWKTYRREAQVVYPPVNTDAFALGSGAREGYYLTASRLVPYKRIDLIVETFAQMPNLRLVVIGDGPEADYIRSKGARNVEFLGYQSFDNLRHHMQRARAFVFAAREDFGIVPVEAQACGTPVIALSHGGTAETIVPFGESPRPTGVWFDEQSVASLRAAVACFEANRDTFDPEICRRNALRFGVARFRRELADVVRAAIQDNPSYEMRHRASRPRVHWPSPNGVHDHTLS